MDFKETPSDNKLSLVKNKNKEIRNYLYTYIHMQYDSFHLNMYNSIISKSVHYILLHSHLNTSAAGDNQFCLFSINTNFTFQFLFVRTRVPACMYLSESEIIRMLCWKP